MPRSSLTKPRPKLRSYDKRYPQPLLESLAHRNPDHGRELNQSPVEHASISFTGAMQLWKSGVEIQLFATPGPTLGSIGVYLPETGVLFTGDAVVTNMPPLLGEANTAVWLATIEQLQQWPDPIYHIIPGRGAPCMMAELTAVATYIRTMRQRLQEHIAAQKPREEIYGYLVEFLNHYPGCTLPADWLKRQLKYSLDCVYDEIQLNGTN